MVSKLRWVGRPAAFGLLALLLSACLKLNMDLNVNADNTVSGNVIFAVQKDLLELTGGSVDDILGTDAPIPEDVEGVTVEPYEDDEFAGQQFVFEGVTLDDFNSGGGEGQLTITRQGDTFTVAGTLDLSSGLSGATGPTGIDPEQFLEGADLRVRLTFPGEVTQSNGEIEGNSVTWVPQVGERLELQATASAVESGGGGSSMTLLLIIAGVVVVAAIVVGIVVSQRRNRAAPAAAGPMGMGPGMGMGSEPGPMAPPSAGAPPPPPPPPSEPQP
jgi:hypothetical protein